MQGGGGVGAGGGAQAELRARAEAARAVSSPVPDERLREVASRLSSMGPLAKPSGRRTAYRVSTERQQSFLVFGETYPMPSPSSTLGQTSNAPVADPEQQPSVVGVRDAAEREQRASSEWMADVSDTEPVGAPRVLSSALSADAPPGCSSFPTCGGASAAATPLQSAATPWTLRATAARTEGSLPGQRTVTPHGQRASSSSSQEPRLAAAWTSAVLAVSGSVAAVKAPQLAAALLRRGVSVDLVVTQAAHSLLQAKYVPTLPPAIGSRLDVRPPFAPKPLPGVSLFLSSLAGTMARCRGRRCRALHVSSRHVRVHRPRRVRSAAAAAR
jgi:hypothetical protein